MTTKTGKRNIGKPSLQGIRGCLNMLAEEARGWPDVRSAIRAAIESLSKYGDDAIKNQTALRGHQSRGKQIRR